MNKVLIGTEMLEHFRFFFYFFSSKSFFFLYKTYISFNKVWLKWYYEPGNRSPNDKEFPYINTSLGFFWWFRVSKFSVFFKVTALTAAELFLHWHGTVFLISNAIFTSKVNLSYVTQIEWSEPDQLNVHKMLVRSSVLRTEKKPDEDLSSYPLFFTYKLTQRLDL